MNHKTKEQAEVSLVEIVYYCRELDFIGVTLVSFGDFIKCLLGRDNFEYLEVNLWTQE